MLSYRHSFHAGNFADVLKHLVLMRILENLVKKDKPFCVIDTHAGAGEYMLDSHYALQNREFDTGIGKLWALPTVSPLVADYLELVKRFNPNDQLSNYPGSPLVTAQYLRPQDRLFLYELHPSEVKLLMLNTQRWRRTKVFHADGLTDSVGLLPPLERRGLVLIDPSYEIKTDYQTVVKTLEKMYKRFAGGSYALWYPVVDRTRNMALEKACQKTGIKNIQLFELGIGADTAEPGMTACGMIVINPPWTLADEMRQVLPWLAEKLGNNGSGSYRIETLAAQ